MVWADAFEQCYIPTDVSVQRICYPDGEPYVEQENLMLAVFDIFKSEIEAIKGESDV